MRFLAHALLALVFILPIRPRNAPKSRPFAHHEVSQDAERYETYLKANWHLDGRDGPALRAEGDRALARDPRAASRSFAGAVVADGEDAAAWIGLARALLAIQLDPNKGSERYDLPVNASGAAYLAYQRAQETQLKAQRARRSRRRVAAALLLASRHRRAEDEPRARRRPERAPALRQAARRARLPHDRLQDRIGDGDAAPVPAVLRDPVARRKSISPSSCRSTARIRKASWSRASSSASKA